MNYAHLMDENPYEILFAKLRTRYGDDGLTRILVPATRNKDTKVLAGRLDGMLLQSWQEEKYSGDNVFKLLKLDGQDRDVFSSPGFITWMSYLTKLDKTDPDQLMYATLKTRYGADGVQEMMNNAEKSAKAIKSRINEVRNNERKVPDDIRKVAMLSHDLDRTNDALARLREEIWRSEGKTGDDIFKMLKLDEDLESARYEIFRNPALGTWASYVMKLHKVNNNEADVVTLLETRFKFGMLGLADGLSTSKISAAKFLQKLQFEGSLANGIHPDTISFRMRAFAPSNDQVEVAYRKCYQAQAPRGN